MKSLFKELRQIIKNFIWFLYKKEIKLIIGSAIFYSELIMKQECKYSFKTISTKCIDRLSIFLHAELHSCEQQKEIAEWKVLKCEKGTSSAPNQNWTYIK